MTEGRLVEVATGLALTIWSAGPWIFRWLMRVGGHRWYQNATGKTQTPS